MKRNTRHPIIAEFHFSPMEHALFQEMQDVADIERLVEQIFGVDVPNPQPAMRLNRAGGRM